MRQKDQVCFFSANLINKECGQMRLIRKCTNYALWLPHDKKAPVYLAAQWV